MYEQRHVYHCTCTYEVMYIFGPVCMKAHIAMYMQDRCMYDRGGFVSGMLALDSIRSHELVLTYGLIINSSPSDEMRC